ncbi:DUF4139 domain-containing protein [Caulobacter sp. S45]|uniref:DUF4139 domain-containing protein n=1 Tax=Caulobacter sp. S45 TaxID=1641861 RepID=UPI00131DFCC7|nr:hypothetical protein [Caulobacter sp. S45]
MRTGLALLLALAIAAPVRAADIAASPPRDLSVTVYRSPYRGAGGIDLRFLNGFALVSETRVVTLPAGESRLRFEGVADGIDPASAIVVGLPSGVIEKNRDAHLLSPSALIALAVGHPVELVRTHPKGGGTERVAGRILSDAEGGVVFETSAGIEALRCSGLSESFSFASDTTGLSATPTLSVLTRSPKPVTATVTLSYLARGFDWSADYVATLSKDRNTLDLGAWLTLANSNGTGFPEARTQVVAGRLNHRTGQVEPIDAGTAILAKCWPRGSTSDTPEPVRLEMRRASANFLMGGYAFAAGAAPAPMSVREVIVTASAKLEQLGDLKLYRTPSRTTIASRQSKQVRLLDKFAVPVERIYGADLPSQLDRPAQAASVLLRTRNDAAHHLGLPLPSGRIAIFQPGGGRPLLVGETNTRDLAEDEEVEWRLGESPDLQIVQTHEHRTIDRTDLQPIPIIPGLLWAISARLDDENRVEISNASSQPRTFELRLSLPAGSSLVRADHEAGVKDGRPIFRLVLPPQSTTIVRYQTGRRPVS